MTDPDEGKAFALVVFDKTIMQFRNRENAVTKRNTLLEEPKLFCEIKEWEPGWMLPWVKFEEDKEE